MAGLGLAAQPQLLGDLNSTPGLAVSSVPGAFAPRGSELYFAATAPFVGRELWVASAAGGLRLRYDLVAGAVGSQPIEIVPIGNGLALSFADRVLYLDLATSGLQSVLVASAPHTLLATGNRLFFFAEDGVRGQQLWVSPTPGAAAVPIGINPSGATGVAAMVPFGAGVAMIVDDGTHGFELWVSDGTAGGTRMVRDLNPGSAWGASNTRPLVFGNEVFFAGDDGVHGFELFASDGSNVRLVHDIVVGPAGSFPGLLTAAGPRFGFSAGPSSARRLLISAGGSGQVASTVDIENLAGEPSGRLWGISIDGFQNDLIVVDSGSTMARALRVGWSSLNSGRAPAMALAGNRLLFNSYTNGRHQLRSSDGTTAGTQVLVDGGRAEITAIAGFADGSAFFAFDEELYGRELWFTDGTPAGTRLFADIEPTRPTQTSSPAFLGEIGGRAIFSASVGTRRALLGTDGTRRGTIALLAASNPAYIASLNDGFLVGEPDRLVRTDGTLGGTQVLANVLASVLPHLSIALDGHRVLFFGLSGGASQLWITDGSPAGTRALLTIDPAGRSLAYGFAKLGARAYYFAPSIQTGYSLWSTDGTAPGTRLEVAFPPALELPRMFGVVRDRLVFARDDGQTGFEPWVSDGTAAGTVLLADLTPGRDSSRFAQDDAVAVGGRLLFKMAPRVFSTDGTPAGTFALPGANASEAIVGLDDVAYLIRTPASNALVLRTDGTMAGTTPVSIVLPTGAVRVRRVSSRLFAISVRASLTGTILISDGTAAGTRVVATNAGDLSLMPLDGGIVYTGYDPATGNEPWFVSIGATAQGAGMGCGVGAVPRLTATEPRFGQQVVLRGEQLGLASAMLLGAPLPTPVRLALPVAGCTLFVDVGALAVGLPANGELRLPVPGGIEFLGVRLGAQVVSIDSTQVLELSNGARLTIGM